MPKRPQEGRIEYQYHRVGEPGTPEMKRWVTDGDPSGMIAIIPGPSDSWSSGGVEARVQEYETILRRMKDRRRQSLEQRIHERATDLRAQVNTQNWNEPETLTHEKIAEELRKQFDPTASEFGITISREFVTRALIAGERPREEFVSGNSQSIIDFKTKPPL